jgi:HAD superfamily hydrolase (TIGR01450 family)
MIGVEEIAIPDIIGRYGVLLLDAFGVLVNSAGALNGAADLIGRLNASKTPYFILTNDASRLPATAAAKYQRYGLGIDPEQIITSGILLKDFFAARHLAGANCVVLGSGDSLRYVEAAGGRIVSPDDSFEVLVVCDEEGFPFLETIDKVLSALFQKIDRRENVQLILPNPDLIYPKADHSFGITSGSIALMLEAALQLRYPHRRDLHFERLGKPYPGIFAEAMRRSGRKDMVMIGDQLETDIRGANAFGIDSIWVTGGVAMAEGTALATELRPTYYLRSIIMG